uniref:Uncharacterized protein n=1 Tax=Sus scrofa TaxID=9823 RepID=A0A4X1SIB5_PIG
VKQKRLGSPRSRCWQIWYLVRAHFLIHRWLSFCHILTLRRREGSLWGLFYKGANSIHEGSTLMT